MSIPFTPLRAVRNSAFNTTDDPLVAAVVGQRIRVHAIVAITGATATTVVFNSKPAGAGTAISPVFSNAVNAGPVLPFSLVPWFETNVGEGLSVTTGATGSATGILVIYSLG